jgi:hypothetical protein
MPSPPPYEAIPEDLISLSINDTHRRTGWPVSTIYDLIGKRRIDSYVLGRRRFIDASSVRALIAAQKESAPTVNRHFGRNAPKATPVGPVTVEATTVGPCTPVGPEAAGELSNELD